MRTSSLSNTTTAPSNPLDHLTDAQLRQYDEWLAEEASAYHNGRAVMAEMEFERFRSNLVVAQDREGTTNHGEKAS